MTPDVYVLAICRRTVWPPQTRAAPASAFAFVAATVAAVRVGLVQGLSVAVLGAATLAAGAIIYDNSGLGVLAYTLGFCGARAGGLQPATAQPANRTGRVAAGADAALARGARAVGATGGVGADRTQHPRRARALPGGALDPARGDRRAAGAGRRYGDDPRARSARARARARGAARDAPRGRGAARRSGDRRACRDRGAGRRSSTGRSSSS